MRSCTLLRAEIKRWYRLNKKQGWLTKINWVIIAPGTTVFHLDFDYNPEKTFNLSKRLQQKKRRKVLVATMLSAAPYCKIQHLVIHQNTIPKHPNLSLSYARLYGIIKYCKLRSIKFAIYPHKLERRGHFMCCKLWDHWMALWTYGPLCHPNKCCSGCIPLETKWAIHWKGEVFSGDAPFWHGLPGNRCGWSTQKFSWESYNESRFHFDRYFEENWGTHTGVCSGMPRKGSFLDGVLQRSGALGKILYWRLARDEPLGDVSG
jgi:hypothetical protein